MINTDVSMLPVPLSRLHNEATAIVFIKVLVFFFFFFFTLIAAAVDYSGSNCNEIVLKTRKTRFNFHNTTAHVQYMSATYTTFLSFFEIHVDSNRM